ncbi:pathogenesis-related protein PRB1-2 [Carica papaya]|uniref:pathogenesis-related protein PRB1-2 n=1 Tax=Carica papaya TaxID=3649 RepID=UPI000B8CBCE9|nr:pathogenesis-related protein PRB1-2 [Carica papaya]
MSRSSSDLSIQQYLSLIVCAMEMRGMFSCGLLLGSFLILSSLPHLSSSLPTHHFPHSRRLLKPKPTTSNKVIQQFLAPHNNERTKLGLPPLKWSKKLAKFASWWANQRRRDCQLIHSNSDYGENLFWGSGKDWKPGDAVAAWAAEKIYYNHGTNTCSHDRDCLHYTQIVWRQSLKIGCAQVVCTSGDTFTTCNYDPHGNVIGQKPF